MEITIKIDGDRVNLTGNASLNGLLQAVASISRSIMATFLAMGRKPEEVKLLTVRAVMAAATKGVTSADPRNREVLVSTGKKERSG